MALGAITLWKITGAKMLFIATAAKTSVFRHVYSLGKTKVIAPVL
jgi:hypothetical protein